MLDWATPFRGSYECNYKGARTFKCIYLALKMTLLFIDKEACVTTGYNDMVEYYGKLYANNNLFCTLVPKIHILHTLCEEVTIKGKVYNTDTQLDEILEVSGINKEKSRLYKRNKEYDIIKEQVKFRSCFVVDRWDLKIGEAMVMFNNSNSKIPGAYGLVVFFTQGCDGRKLINSLCDTCDMLIKNGLVDKFEWNQLFNSDSNFSALWQDEPMRPATKEEAAKHNDFKSKSDIFAFLKSNR